MTAPLWLATNNNGIVHVTGNMEQPETLHCQKLLYGEQTVTGQYSPLFSIG